MQFDVCLSGSGTKFPMHIGFLQALKDKHYDEIKTGFATSGGSLVLGLLACGHPIESIWTSVKRLNFSDYIKVSPWRIAAALVHFWNFYINNGKKYRKLLLELTNNRTFCEADFDLNITGSNVTDGCLEVFNFVNSPSMKIGDAIYISTTIPGTLKPMVINGKSYRDGGMYKDFPIDLLLEKIDGSRPSFAHLITSNKKHEGSVWTVFHEIGLALDCLIDANIDQSLNKLDPTKPVTLVTSEMAEVSMVQFDVDIDTKTEMFEVGYRNTI